MCVGDYLIRFLQTGDLKAKTKCMHKDMRCKPSQRQSVDKPRALPTASSSHRLQVAVQATGCGLWPQGGSFRGPAGKRGILFPKTFIPVSESLRQVDLGTVSFDLFLPSGVLFPLNYSSSAFSKSERGHLGLN